MHDQADIREAEPEARAADPDQTAPVTEPAVAPPAEEAPAAPAKEAGSEAAADEIDPKSAALEGLLAKVKEVLAAEDNKGARLGILVEALAQAICDHADDAKEALHLHDEVRALVKKRFRDIVQSDEFAKRTGERAIFINEPPNPSSFIGSLLASKAA